MDASNIAHHSRLHPAVETEDRGAIQVRSSSAASGAQARAAVGGLDADSVAPSVEVTRNSW
ncbi:MAG: hypothetical protein H8K10_18845 [Nitrospira sp.]|nr:hypothetical protein [Nitrospira sp.]